jgi:hypothetical protein
MIHQQVESTNTGVETSIQEVLQQLAADREAMNQLHHAITFVAKVVNGHEENGRVIEQRLDEQARMRLDDHRLHVGALTAVRTGVGELELTQQKLAGYIDSQDKAVFLEMGRKIDELVPRLVEDKVTSIATALGAIKQTEGEMKCYLVELEKARP